jgi:hypothetical protein
MVYDFGAFETDMAAQFGAFETDMATQVAELRNELRVAKLEKDEMEMAKDIAVAMSAKLLADQSAADASDKEPEEVPLFIPIYNNRARHVKILAQTKHIIDDIDTFDALNDVDKQCALWFCQYHVTKLMEGADKPACFESYKRLISKVRPRQSPIPSK